VKIAVVILAGGEGRRIGGDKPQRVLGGRRLINFAEALARQWSDRAAVAVRKSHQAVGITLPIIRDQAELQGPLGGLAAALMFADEAGCEAVLTIPADMPFLPLNLLERLSVEKGNAAAALASSGAYLHPICGLWSTRVLGSLPDYVATAKRSLRALAEAVGYVEVEWATDPLDPFFNINSPDDLVRAQRLLTLTRSRR
jgi:molybdenum cofactor guanylyltransferase